MMVKIYRGLAILLMLFAIYFALDFFIWKTTIYQGLWIYLASLLALMGVIDAEIEKYKPEAKFLGISVLEACPNILTIAGLLNVSAIILTIPYAFWTCRSFFSYLIHAFDGPEIGIRIYEFMSQLGIARDILFYISIFLAAISLVFTIINFLKERELDWC